MALIPLFIIGVLLYFDYLIDQVRETSKSEDPRAFVIDSIPRCEVPDDCVSLGYFINGPEESYIHEVMALLATKNDLSFGKDVVYIPTNSSGEIINYPFEHRNKTQIAVIFCTDNWTINVFNYSLSIPCQFERLEGKKLVYYSVYYNMSQGFEIPYFFKLRTAYPSNQIAISTKRSLDEAIIAHFTGNPDFRLELRQNSYPFTENKFYKGYDFVSAYGCFFFYFPIAVGSPVLLPHDLGGDAR